MKFGKDWKKMQPLIKTRSLVQIRTHAQKVFKKIGLKRGYEVPYKPVEKSEVQGMQAQAHEMQGQAQGQGQGQGAGQTQAPGLQQPQSHSALATHDSQGHGAPMVQDPYSYPYEDDDDFSDDEGDDPLLVLANSYTQLIQHHGPLLQEDGNMHMTNDYGFLEEHDDAMTAQLLQTLQTFASEQHEQYEYIPMFTGNMPMHHGMGHMGMGQQQMMQGMGQQMGGHSGHNGHGHMGLMGQGQQELNEAFQYLLPQSMEDAQGHGQHGMQYPMDGHGNSNGHMHK